MEYITEAELIDKICITTISAVTSVATGGLHGMPDVGQYHYV